MTRKVILRRWLALKQGAGQQHASRVSYYLVFGSFAIFATCLAMSRIYELPTLATMISGVVVGWLIAEANALRFRLEHFSIYREYMDWQKIERDLAAD